MMNHAQIASILANVSYENCVFHLNENPLYLQVECPDGLDNITGEKLSWKGRKWLLSEHMIESEIVQTAWAAVQFVIEHEAREKFKYHDLAIYNPHIDIQQLMKMVADPSSIAMRLPLSK